jgi:hypothetical protein
MGTANGGRNSDGGLDEKADQTDLGTAIEAQTVEITDAFGHMNPSITPGL